jgi:chitinase
VLGSSYIITHARMPSLPSLNARIRCSQSSKAVAPWFKVNYNGAGYLVVHNTVGSLIDWYNIQFYNRELSFPLILEKQALTVASSPEGSLYQDCTSLLTTSGGQFPGTSIFEIAANGVDLNKLVIGKPALPTDANSGAGYVDPATLATCVAQGKSKGWSAGVMTWEVRFSCCWMPEACELICVTRSFRMGTQRGSRLCVAPRSQNEEKIRRIP